MRIFPESFKIMKFGKFQRVWIWIFRNLADFKGYFIQRVKLLAEIKYIINEIEKLIKGGEKDDY